MTKSTHQDRPLISVLLEFRRESGVRILSGYFEIKAVTGLAITIEDPVQYL